MADLLSVLCIGDIVGKPGRQVVHQKLPGLVRDKGVDLVVANAENCAGGSGLTPNLFGKLRSYGVDVMTLGDHAFKRAEIAETLATSERLLRPANLSAKAPGRTHTIVRTAGGRKVAVVCLIGRIYMTQLPADSPFDAADVALAKIGKGADAVICDLHCEATSESIALGRYLDGRASLCFGTHTHTPTADARILPNGTGYITDVGMTGPYDSVLGRKVGPVLQNMTTNLPAPFDVATNDVRLCGVLGRIDPDTRRCVELERIEVAGENADKGYDADDRRGA